MFIDLCDLEKLARHIHPHQAFGRELAFSLGVLASGSATDDTYMDTMDLVSENITHLYESNQGRYALMLSGALSAALESEKTLEQFIAELPEE